MIVDFAFLRVREDFVGLGDFFELLGGVGIVWVLVGMEFQGSFSARKEDQYGVVDMEEEESLPVGFFNFILGGSGFYAESIVELCFCYHS